MEAPSANTRLLWMTKIVILILFSGYGVVGGRTFLWPIDTWPMYATARPKTPGPFATEIELRVVVHGGKTHRLAPTDLIPFARASAVPRLIASAFDAKEHKEQEADRAYLTTLVDRALSGVEAETIESWRVSWRVEPFALPPLDRDAPAEEVRQAGFSVRRRAMEEEPGS